MSERRAIVREVVAVLGGSFAAAAAFTWPLVFHLQARVRDTVDALYTAWSLDWVQYAVEHGKNPYNANIFLPDTKTLAYSDSFFGVAIPTLPLRWLGLSPIGVLNASTILGLTTMAAGAYLFARLVTGSKLAGAVAGATFAFGPFGSIVTGHLSMAASCGIPLAAAAAWWLADRARDEGSVRGPAIALGAILVGQMTVSFYPGTYASVAAGLVLLVRFRSLGRRGVLTAAGALVVTAACAGLLAIPNLQISSREPTYKRPLAEVGPQGANFVATQPDLVVWGDLLGFEAGEKPNATFPGVTILVLGAIGAVAGWRARNTRRTVAITGGVLTIVGAVLAIGTAAEGARQYAPYRLLYELGPPFSVLRATGRAWLIGLVGLGLLTGLGAIAVADWLRTHARASARTAAIAVGTIAVVLMLFEGFEGWGGFPDVRPRAVDVELARRPEPGAVVYLPMNKRTDNQVDLSYFEQPMNLLGLTAHHRATPNGLSGFTPPSYFETSRRLRTLPEDRALRRLRKLGVRFVVVHPSVEGSVWEDLLDPERAAPLRLLGTFDGDLLYEVPRP